MPDTTALRIGFIGSGRVANGLALAFASAGYDIAAVASRRDASAAALASRFDKCRAVSGQQVVDLCDLVFITTPDDSIGPTASALTWRSDQFAVHCSGATEISVLKHAVDCGARIGGFHPMQSFSDPQTAARAMAGSTVTIEADGTLTRVLETLATDLGCRINHLPPGKRALYHASAGYGSQFLNVLLAAARDVWKEWDASDEDIVRAFLPMMRGTLDAIEQGGIAGSMPGPVSRGDVGSITAHMTAMAMMPPEAAAFYAEHARRSVDLAVEAEKIDGETATTLRGILRSPLPGAE